MYIRLGVNIDHVATVRQARGGKEPDPVKLAVLAELGGADGITVHLREDRRHIQERDLRLLAETLAVPLNFELARAEDVLAIVLELRPAQATLVPERRAELTTEGGLDVAADVLGTARVLGRLAEAGIRTALFIDPDPAQVEASARAGAVAVELHTGAYANAKGSSRQEELRKLQTAGAMALDRGLALHAGHGLDYWNVRDVAAIQGMEELNIGHSIVSRALLMGMERAVRGMRRIMDRAL